MIIINSLNFDQKTPHLHYKYASGDNWVVADSNAYPDGQMYLSPTQDFVFRTYYDDTVVSEIQMPSIR